MVILWGFIKTDTSSRKKIKNHDNASLSSSLFYWKIIAYCTDKYSLNRAPHKNCIKYIKIPLIQFFWSNLIGASFCIFFFFLYSWSCNVMAAILWLSVLFAEHWARKMAASTMCHWCSHIKRSFGPHPACWNSSHVVPFLIGSAKVWTGRLYLSRMQNGHRRLTKLIHSGGRSYYIAA